MLMGKFKSGWWGGESVYIDFRTPFGALVVGDHSRTTPCCCSRSSAACGLVILDSIPANSEFLVCCLDQCTVIDEAFSSYGVDQWTRGSVTMQL